MLYMDPPLAAQAMRRWPKSCLQFVPHARVEPTDLYPSKMQDPEAGREFAELAIAFIDEVEKAQV